MKLKKLISIALCLTAIGSTAILPATNAAAAANPTLKQYSAGTNEYGNKLTLEFKGTSSNMSDYKVFIKVYSPTSKNRNTKPSAKTIAKGSNITKKGTMLRSKKNKTTFGFVLENKRNKQTFPADCETYNTWFVVAEKDKLSNPIKATFKLTQSQKIAKAAVQFMTRGCTRANMPITSTYQCNKKYINAHKKYLPGDSIYRSSDRYIATVLRATGIKNVPIGPLSEIQSYLQHHVERINVKYVREGDVILQRCNGQVVHGGIYTGKNAIAKYDPKYKTSMSERETGNITYASYHDLAPTNMYSDKANLYKQGYVAYRWFG